MTLLCGSALCGHAAVVNFESDAGAVPDDDSNATVWKNGAAMNATLAALKPGDTLYFPNKTFHLMGGIKATGLNSVTLQFDGTIVFSDDIDGWPRSGNGTSAPALMCMYFSNVNKLIICCKVRFRVKMLLGLASHRAALSSAMRQEVFQLRRPAHLRC